MSENRPDNPGVIAPPPFIYLGSLLLGLIINAIWPRPFLPRRLASFIGPVLIGIAANIAQWFFLSMRRAQTSANPADPTTAIVKDGPFRYSRNPVYVAFATLYVGIATLVNSIWPLLLLPATLLVVQRGVIEREERYLARKFGAEYLDYKAQVRRWL